MDAYGEVCIGSKGHACMRDEPVAVPQVQSAVLHTSSSLCNISFGAPAPSEIPKRKLRRIAGGNPEALGRAGQNFRVFALENPCLLCEYTSSKAIILVCSEPSSSRQEHGVLLILIQP